MNQRHTLKVQGQNLDEIELEIDRILNSYFGARDWWVEEFDASLETITLRTGGGMAISHEQAWHATVEAKVAQFSIES